MTLSHTPTPSAHEPDLSNRQLGDYVIGRRLGRGGMADVYLAEQQSLRRQVALKVLRSTLSKDETFVRRFHNEAQAAASLVHANIVQIYEVGCVDGVHFIAQEYVDGQNLKQLIVRSGKMDPRRAVKVIRQVAAALHKAGQRGIVHRDIKPENILLTSDGEVKVADFGLARITSDDARVDLTQVGMTMGTPLYMSPEQVEGQPLDPRSDLYSFGIMCYEMLSGRPPFEGDNAFSVAVQHLKNDPPRLETVCDDLPGGLGRVVHKLLEKKPVDRYQSAAETLRELRAIPIEGLEDWSADGEDWNSVEWESIASSRVAATQQLSTVMQLERRQPSPWRWLLVPLMGVILAFAIGGGLAWLNRPKYMLDVVDGEVASVPKLESAQAQYYHARAMLTKSERAYLAVEANFPRGRDPGNEEYIRKAKLELARLYMANPNRLNEARDILDDLVSQDADVAIQKRALALQANLLARQPGTERDADAPLTRIVQILKSQKDAGKTPDRELAENAMELRDELEKQVLRREFDLQVQDQLQIDLSRGPRRGS